jgi:two-component SAPR family response regulator
MMLEDHGWSVGGPFRSNRLALDFLAHTRPDVALLDFNIADGSSAETAHRLRELGIPYVVVSGYPKSMTNSPDLQQAEWLDKPFSEDRVIASLATAMRRGVAA